MTLVMFTFPIHSYIPFFSKKLRLTFQIGRTGNPEIALSRFLNTDLDRCHKIGQFKAGNSLKVNAKFYSIMLFRLCYIYVTFFPIYVTSNISHIIDEIK